MRPEDQVQGADLPATDGSAAMTPKLLDFQPAFEAVLPPDWVLIGRCRAGEGGGTGGGGCFVLAHAEIGVALVDLLPMRTPQAEAQLRRLLNAVDFSALCRGYIPIVHCEIEPEHLGQLRERIEEAFAYDSVLTIADRGRWVGVLRRMLQAGVTWEALEGPLSGPAAERPAHGPRPWMVRPVLRLARAGLMGCGLLAVFGLGFATALLLPAEPASPPPVASGFGVAAVAASLPPQAPPELPAIPVTVPTPVEEVSLPAPASLLGPQQAEAAEAPPTAEIRNLAMATPPKRSTRLPLPIDRRCSEAVFRFQQGASLTAQEMAHVRQGCVSLR